MKKQTAFSLLLALLCLTQMQAQQDTVPTKLDTTELKLGDTKIVIINKEEKKTVRTKQDTIQPRTNQKKQKKHHNKSSMWEGIQFGTNTLSGFGSVKLPDDADFFDADQWKNRSFGLHLISRRWDLGIPYVGISTGLGLTFNRYAIGNNATLHYDSDGFWSEEDQTHDLIKNYLKTTHLTMPFLLEFNTHKDADDGFRLAAGFEAAYLIGAHTKIKYNEGDKRVVQKSRGSFNMAPFRFSPIIMLGYRHLGIYIKSAGTPLFIEGKGPRDIFHASVGLQWAF